MSEYIKREDALTAVAGLLNVIEKMPNADVVEVRHGEWTKMKWADLNNWATWRCCSCCGKTLEKYFKGIQGYGRKDFPHFNYYPNCGAKMDAERKDGERTIFIDETIDETCGYGEDGESE